MVRSVPVGRAAEVAATTVLTRWRGALRVTAVCKATFAFASDREMALAPPVDIVRSDVHIAKNPMRSVRASSDLAPHLERVDVMFVGRAHAPGGAKVPRMNVRLAVFDEHTPVLDKRLTVIGDRVGEHGAPALFQAMPLVYERAFGGLRFQDNPLGVGVGGDGKVQPNLLDVDPTRSRAVAGFGPRSQSWAARKKLLRGRPHPKLDGIAELPDDFDWIYFQSAPPDQWLEALPRRAWLTLEGLNPRAERLRMRLPEARAWAKLEGPASAPPFELRADTLFIDGDAEHCTVTWRASTVVPSVEALDDAWLAVALELPGRPLAWPTEPTVDARASRSQIDPGTVPLDDAPKRPAPQGGTVIVDDDARAAAGTMLIEAAPSHVGTMLIEATPSPVGTMLLETAPNPVGTMLLHDEPVASTTLPFVGKTKAPGPRPPAEPVPGAPWSPQGTARRPRPAMNPMAHTQAPATEPPAPSARELAERERVAEQARLANEAELREAAAKRAAADAVERRALEREAEAKAAAERFDREQAEAKKRAEQREAEEAAARARGIQDLKKKAYGGFDD